MTQSVPICNFKRILLCAPREKSLALQAAFRVHHIDTFVCPTLEIQPLADADLFHALLSELNTQDRSIFVSPIAAREAFACMNASERAICQQQICFAVGASTHASLQKMGVHDVRAPKKIFNSESLLALPELHNIKGQRFFIFKGDAGRDLLSKTLAERGAEVIEIMSYRAVCPDVDVPALLATWKESPFDAVIATSQGVLENLYQVLGKHHALLAHTTITLMNERSEAWARARGMKQFRYVNDASVSGLLSLFLS
jgi:uroporphyrinogen-III synthase